MNDNRTGGMLLVLGSVAGIITMALHPVAPHGGVLLSPHGMETLARLDRIVHGLALAGVAAVFLGALALTQRLAAGNRLALAALVAYAFAAVAIMSAGVMSGFVGADILGKMVEGDPKLESRRMLLDYTFRLNQGYASVFLVGSCAAIFLWSLAMLRTRQLSAGLAWYGLVLGSVLVLALFSSNLPLDVHGFGLVALLESIWFIGVGSLLMRSTDGAEDQPV